MPNPLYQGEGPPVPGLENWYDLICVTPAEEAQALSYEYGVWGLDCIKGTPDDDYYDIGQDECASGMTWDQTIYACVGIQPNLCPNSAEPLCI